MDSYPEDFTAATFIFTTYDADGAPVAPSSALEAADVKIYKNGSATQRSSESGYTMTSPFDGHTGTHMLVVDLSDNTDAGFFAAGAVYDVFLDPDETVDGLAVNEPIGKFWIRAREDTAGVPRVNAHYITNIDASGLGRWVNNMSNGTADAGGSTTTMVDAALTQADDIRIGSALVFNSGNNKYCAVTITDFDAATDTVTFVPALPNAVAAGDTYVILPLFNAADLRSINGVAQTATLDSLNALIGALNDLSAAQVNAEVVDALNTDTYAEPGQEAPGATVSIAAKIGYLYKAWRNRSNQTASTYQLFNDDALTVDQKATVSDDGTTAEKGEIGTGP